MPDDDAHYHCQIAQVDLGMKEFNTQSLLLGILKHAEQIQILKTKMANDPTNASTYERG